MAPVARHVKMVAKPGQGDALAAKMLEVAGTLAETPGCLQYLINRCTEQPDEVWITELWRSQEDIDAALKAAGESKLMPAVLALLEPGAGERVDLEPLGGVGDPTASAGSEVVNLLDVEDMAPKFGFAETGEARFARERLGAVHTGVSLQRLRPGRRQAFGHHHQFDEEIYVVLSGGGSVALGDQVRELRALDAVRVAPGTRRAFEAGPDGLELLAFGTHHAGDAAMVPGWWAAAGDPAAGKTAADPQ
jgi:quinol monooxygenase YgiN/quercetin dioxygenase-like cupin family protein